MRLLDIVLAAAVLSLGAVAGRAQEPAPATSDAASAPAPLKPKLICRRAEVTGSRTAGKRECKTSADWAAESRQNRPEVNIPQARTY